MSRWIKIHDKIVDWEWFTDANVLQVFIYLLVTANPKDKRYRGVNIKRGQTMTSFYMIADMLHVDVRIVRKSINKLESTGEIKVERHSGRYGYSLITICNYSCYQDKGANNVPINAPLSVPINAPLSVPNIRIEDNKSNKNILLERDNTREENFSNIAPPDEVYEWTDIGIVMKRDAGWIDSSLMVLRRKCPSITEEQLYVAIDTFCELQQTSGTFRYTKNKFKQHFTNWVNTQIKTFTNGNNRKEFGTSYIDRIEESKRELREGVVKSVLSGLDIERAGSYDEYVKSL